MYEALFKDVLYSSVPPEKNVEHDIVIEGDGKLQNRLLLQLSPEELKVAEEYADSLLKEKTIRTSRCICGAPLFHGKKIMNV